MKQIRNDTICFYYSQFYNFYVIFDSMTTPILTDFDVNFNNIKPFSQFLFSIFGFCLKIIGI